MTTKKQSLLMLLRLAVLYVFVSTVSAYDRDAFLLRKNTTIVLMVYSVALLLYFADHIIEKKIRGYLVGIAGLITLWVVLRGAKYIAFEETEIVARHLWYLYYIPALFLPLLSLFASLSVGTDGTEGLRRVFLLPFFITAALALLVLTNDLHQLVFRFHPGFANWDSDYSRTKAFYLIYGWIGLLIIGVNYILFSRCRVSASRRLIWIPMLPALFGLIYLSLYARGAWLRVNGELFGELPEAVCFTTAGIWLSFIYIGLIPSNAEYGRLFVLSDLAAQIADRSYQVIYRSRSAVPLNAEQLHSGTDVALDRNTRLHRKEIHGGFVYWQDDVTEINRINEELWEVGERLSEEVELTRLKNELEEKRAQIEARRRTYDEIDAGTLAQSKRISELCAQAEQLPESYEERMRTVVLLASYIKRYANLSLLAADAPRIRAGELFLAIRESLRAVEDMKIPVSALCDAEGPVSSKAALEAYALFEQCLEQALPALRGVQVSLSGGCMKTTFEGVSLSLPEGSGAMLTREDGNSYLRIPLGEAGEAV